MYNLQVHIHANKPQSKRTFSTEKRTAQCSCSSGGGGGSLNTLTLFLSPHISVASYGHITLLYREVLWNCALRGQKSHYPHTVEREIFISEYFHYLEMTFRLKYIFVMLATQHTGSVCTATYMIIWHEYSKNVFQTKNSHPTVLEYIVM